MRVLVVCADYGIPLNGTKGASVHLRAMACALAEEGARVVVACRGATPPPGWRLPVRALPAGPRPSQDDFSPEAMNAADRAALEAIRDGFAYDAIYERYALWATAGLDTARRLQLPFALEVNAPLTAEAERWRTMAFREAAMTAETRLAREATLLAPVSEPIARHLERLGAPNERIMTLPNGVGDDFLRVGQDRLAAGAGVARPRRATTIVFAGSLKPWHGIEVLLDAFERLGGEAAGYALRIIGDGPAREVVQAAVARGTGVTWCGALAHEAIPAELRHADIAVAPYLEEGDGYFSPLKVVEYQAAGLPVVASGGEGVREALQDGATGLLVPAGDAAALADGIAELNADPARAHELALAGWREAGQRAWRVNARRVRSALGVPVLS